jgi:lipopolysaccharide cholinephosphotransferase
MALIPVDITENKSIMDIVHTKLLEMLDFIIDICKKENINFYLSYGSALGAYREAKIIPHDDDIDLDMNIDDFIKFISVINKYNNPKFEFKYFGNQPHEKMI